MNKFKKQQKGFTLMEMMIAMTIMAILISMSVVSYEKMSYRTSIRGLSNDIAGVITQARMSALTNGETISVCPVLNAFPPPNTSLAGVNFPPQGAACEPWTRLTAGTADNQIGFIVFKDPLQDGKLTNRDDLLLRIPFDDHNGKVGISADTTIGNASTSGTSESKNAIRFTRKGMLASTAGTVVITSKIPPNLAPGEVVPFSGPGFDRGVVVAPSTGRITNKSL